MGVTEITSALSSTTQKLIIVSEPTHRRRGGAVFVRGFDF
jgi:hypothetical protein